jgi:hypothetical protein
MSPSAYAPSIFSVEHIIPKVIEWNNDLSNLALACSTCNNHKYTKIKHIDPVTTLETDLYHPRKDYWLNHFKWSDDGKIIIGITAKGRATVDLLDVNRQSNVNFRELLMLINIHPPLVYPID